LSSLPGAGFMLVSGRALAHAAGARPTHSAIRNPQWRAPPCTWAFLSGLPGSWFRMVLERALARAAAARVAHSAIRNGGRHLASGPF